MPEQMFRKRVSQGFSCMPAYRTLEEWLAMNGALEQEGGCIGGDLERTFAVGAARVTNYYFCDQCEGHWVHVAASDETTLRDTRRALLEALAQYGPYDEYPS